MENTKNVDVSASFEQLKEDYRKQIKGIYKKCLNCCSGNPYGIEKCDMEKCALHPFRLEYKKFENK